MISKREDIAVALFTLISSANYQFEVATFTRKCRVVSDYSNGQLPAIELVSPDEEATSKGIGLPISWKIQYYVYLLFNSGNPSTEPETLNNNFLDAVESALAPAPAAQGKQTLGGLVVDCKINGKLVKDPGFISGVGAAAVPIEITITS